VSALTSFDRLPVKFGKIAGHFNMSYVGLTSFEGFPRVIEGDCWCTENKLTSFEGAPQYIKGSFFVQDNLISLISGFPEFVGGLVNMNYNEKLPVLRLLNVNGGIILGPSSWPDQKKGDYATVQNILNKYKGQGKKGMLGAGVELTRAGYKDNARW
jgi:hypothetical protein